jgi:NAD(P)H-hydrate epimerase
MLPRRNVFSHKGSYGHALLIAGSFGKMGAALLASRACLRTGTGLVTIHLPACGYEIQQTYTPEVMCSIDGCEDHFSVPPPADRFAAVGAGPGLGTHPDTKDALVRLIENTKVPLVLDADALNILSSISGWQELLPENTILTPHPGEFTRLFGETGNSWKRIELQKQQSVRYKIVIVLKGARSTISFPDGRIFFNPSGNPGMATAGSGDVLTGIILGLAAQGMAPANAAVAGVYLHGLAGDLAARRHSMPAMIASDITGCLGKAFQKIYSQREQDFSYI